MADETADDPSVWDPLVEFGDLDEADHDWDAIIGEPPDWYYPLVGKVAVTTGGLERRLALAALRLLGGLPGRAGELAFWLSTTQRLQTLLAAAKDQRPEFDGFVKEMAAVWRQRGEVVHVSTGWHDWEAPEEPSGWHYEHPRTGTTVYLDDPRTRPALEAVLAKITDLEQRVWDFYVSLDASAGDGGKSHPL